MALAATIATAEAGNGIAHLGQCLGNSALGSLLTLYDEYFPYRDFVQKIVNMPVKPFPFLKVTPYPGLNTTHA